jgi:AAA+ superfamily predicted ATPase
MGDARTAATLVGQTDGEGPASSPLPPSLAAALARLDARLRRAVAAAGSVYGPDAADDPHRGLYVGDDEVARLLARAPCVPLLGPTPDEPRLVATAGENSSLSHVARTFGLEPLDVEIVLVALAPELDLRYERLYAYLQDDIARRRPSVDLALNLLCADAAVKLGARARFAACAPLREHRLIELISDPARSETSLLARGIKLDDQVVSALTGEVGLDPRLSGCARLVQEPRMTLDELDLEPAAARRLAALARTARDGRTPLRLSFEGRPGSGRTRVAEALASDLGVPLLVVDLSRAVAPTPDAAPAGVALAVREARLHGAVLMLAALDALRGGDRDADLDLLLRAIESHPGVVIFAGAAAFAPSRTATRRRPAGLVSVPFAVPDAGRRRRSWHARLLEAGFEPSSETVETLAERFRLTAGQIADAVASAVDERSQLAVEGAPVPPDDALFAGARAQAAGALGSLTQKVTARRRFEDIVLPDDLLQQLHDVRDTMRWRSRIFDDWGFGARLSLGKGLNVLFTGPSGTGKTLAAEILATELELELYKIDLSAVVNKYIGETEKSLARIFDEAEAASAMLFFDEADALFGKRSEVKDAHDRYANIEVGFLLQRMEEYDGTVVLASNLPRNMDQAFVRRMQFALEFPLPDEADRLRIWRAIWPTEVPLCADIDIDELARRFELSGGNIRNIALAAAFLAAAGGCVTREHVLRAARREYQKLGQVILGGTM